MVQPVDPGAGGFGVQPGGYTPYGTLNALYPYLTFGPTTALQLAQLQGQNALDAYRAQVSAAAQQGANAAQLAAAQIAARGGLAQQNVQSGTQASIANANNQAMLIAAAGGDRNAIARLNAQNALAAALANQQAQQQTLGLLASTGLRDQLQARAFTRGFAPQAAFGSALSAANVGPLQNVVAPTAQFQAYDPLTQMASAPQGSLNLSGINMNVGSSIPSAPNINMGELFGNYNSMLSNLFGNFGINFEDASQPTTPTTAGTWQNPAVTQNPNGSYTYSGPNFSYTNPAMPDPMNPGRYLPQMAKGGTLSKRGALVGERGPEAIVWHNGKYEVIPLSPMADGGDLNRYGTVSAQPVQTTPPTSGPPPALTGGVTGAAPVESTPAGGTSPSVTVKPDGTISIGGSFNPPAQPNATQTGKEIQALPAYRAMFGDSVNSYPGQQTFNLPEYGLTGLLGPAQLARLLSASSPVGKQEQQDLLDLLTAGGYSLPMISDVVNRFTVGWRPPVRSVGF